MRAFFALVWHELREMRALLAAAAVASLMPLVAPLLSTVGSNPPEDVREAVVWVLVLVLVPLFALLLGANFIGRDLAEGRIGFYYAQPLAGTTIWFAKLAAVWAMLFSVQTVMMAPTALMSPDPFYFFAPADWIGPYDPLWFVAAPLWIGPLLLVLVGHGVGLVWRARSAWVVIDLVALTAVVGMTWIFIRPFLPPVAPGVFTGGLVGMIVITIAGLMAAGAVDRTVGRVDTRRSLRAFSTTLWPFLLVGCFSIGAWSMWVRSATPWDLDGIDEVGVGSGDWIAVTGDSAGRFDYRPRFLVNCIDGRWVPAGPAVRWNGLDVRFSADGNRAVYTIPRMDLSWEIFTVDLETKEPTTRATGIELSARWRGIALTADGRRGAVIDGQNVEVYDLETGRQLAAVRIEKGFTPVWSSFDSAGLLRIQTHARWKHGSGAEQLWKMFLLDVDEKRLVDDRPPQPHWREWRVEGNDGNGAHLEWTDVDQGHQLRLISDREGEMLADLGMVAWQRDFRIHGDLILVIRQERGGDSAARVEIRDPGGRLLHEVDLGRQGSAVFGGEVAPGRIAFGVHRQGDFSSDELSFATAVVDIEKGSVVQHLDGYRPILYTWRVDHSPDACEVGSRNTKMVVGVDFKIHLWNPQTNEIGPLLLPKP